MSEEYPLYPELNEEGKEEAQRLVDKFKDNLRKAAEEVLSTLYTDVVTHIESDSWGNYRNHIMDGMRDYKNRLTCGDYDFKAIRQQIFKDFKEEIIKDLNQDLVKENEELKARIDRMIEDANIRSSYR